MKTNTTFLRTALASLILCLGMVAFAQVHVTGVVIDAATGETIIGANIVEIGTTNGTITDFDGNFELDVQSGAQLEISYMGYKTQTLAAAANMNIKMGEDSEQLDEVVVVGYGVVKKNDATGSVTAIKPDEMNKGLNTNVQDMLSGKIAGVNITSASGAPGAGSTIRIRGGSSLYASNEPLIVIDGLAMDNDGLPGASNGLAMVNPNDIESMTVLKDASATAIYGSRASNGVIIITTKKGKAGSKPKFSYDGNVSASFLTNRLATLTGEQIRMLSTAEKHPAEQTAFLGMANTNWQDHIYQVGVGTDHNFSITGGTKHMPYRFSLGYTYLDGTVKTSNMQRVTASMNLSPSFFQDHLKINLNAKGLYIYNRYNAGCVGEAIAYDPTLPVMYDDASAAAAGFTMDQANLWYGGYMAQGGQSPAGDAYHDSQWPYTFMGQKQSNPVALLNATNNRANTGSFVGNIEADYKIHGFEDLRLHANFGADYSAGLQKNSIAPYSPNNHYWGWEQVDDRIKYNLSFNCYAQYYKDFNENHHFDIMAGYEWQHFLQRNRYQGNGTWQQTNDSVSLRGQVYENTAYYRNSATQSYLVSFFGRANYIALNRYMVTVTLRADGSSRFAKDHRWGIFPSVALGWKIKEEPWLRDVSWLSELKLRAGYGITGQQNIGDDSPFMVKYTKAENEFAYYPAVTGEPTSTNRPEAYNPELTWEKTTTYNVGVDYSFLNNRITGAIDYYYRVTNDLLNRSTPVPVGTNFRARVPKNVGSLVNQGLEFSVNAIAIDRKHFRWDIGYNMAWNANKITKLVDTGEEKPIDLGTQVLQVGYPAFAFYVYETRKNESTGLYELVDRDGVPGITPDDRYIYHKPAADVTMGFNMKFQFYNFDLGFNLRASIGNYVFNSVLQGGLYNVSTVYKGDRGGYSGLKTESFALYYEGYKTTQVDPEKWSQSDIFIENASFLRCDNITLGYTFDKPKVKARIYATVSNPFVITGYSGLDPEHDGGYDGDIYPRSMTAIVGASVQF